MTWNIAKKLKKVWKMRNTPCRTEIWVETVKKMEYEKCTLYDLDNRENSG